MEYRLVPQRSSAALARVLAAAFLTGLAVTAGKSSTLALQTARLRGERSGRLRNRGFTERHVDRHVNPQKGVSTMKRSLIKLSLLAVLSFAMLNHLQAQEEMLMAATDGPSECQSTFGGVCRCMTNTCWAGIFTCHC